MSLVCSQVRSLELALLNLESTLTALCLGPNPNPIPHIPIDPWEVEENLLVRQALRRIFHESRTVLDFTDPVNLFSAAHVTAIDNLITSQLHVLRGIDPQTDMHMVVGLLRDVAREEFNDRIYGQDCRRVVYTVLLVRLERILNYNRVNIQLSGSATDRENGIGTGIIAQIDCLREALVFVDNYVNGRVLSDPEKQSVLAGFFRFVHPIFMPEDTFTVFATEGREMYLRFREPLRANGYEEVVERLDRLFQVQDTGSRSTEKRKALGTP